MISARVGAAPSTGSAGRAAPSPGAGAPPPSSARRSQAAAARTRSPAPATRRVAFQRSVIVLLLTDLMGLLPIQRAGAAAVRRFPRLGPRLSVLPPRLLELVLE